MGSVYQKETRPNRIEMFYHKIKMISQKNAVLIWSDLSLYEDNTTGPSDHLTQGILGSIQGCTGLTKFPNYQHLMYICISNACDMSHMTPVPKQMF